MEQSWEEWPLHMEMGQDNDFLEQSHPDDDDDQLFLRDIILQNPAEIETQSFHNPGNSNIVHDNFTTTTTTIAASVKAGAAVDEINGGKRSSHSSTPRRYILSFDNSTMIPATPEPFGDEKMGTRSSKSNNSPLSSRKMTLENRNIEPNPKGHNQGGKKNRSHSQTMDHIMAERKRRQELTEKFIALSATIPELKKTDKASILREAINYVKQLQERVSELEKLNNKGSSETIIFLNKTEIFVDEDCTSSETSSQDCCKTNIELLPDVEAKVLGNEVLIEIHCEKENGIEREILDQLENFHLCVTGSSVLPFGNSTLGITIIAQMGDEYKTTVNDLVKNLRQVLLNHITCDTDPF